MLVKVQSVVSNLASSYKKKKDSKLRKDTCAYF